MSSPPQPPPLPAATADDFADGGTFYATLVEHLPLQIWTARPDGKLDYVNQKVLEFFSRSKEQMLEEGWQDVVHSADLAIVLKRWKHSLETGEPYEVEFRLQRGSDRFYRWHIGRADPIRDAQGAIVKWVGTNTDINEQKRQSEVYQAGQELERHERDKLIQVFMQVPALMAIYRGPRFEVKLVNPTWNMFFGHLNPLGRTLRELFPELKGQGIFELLEHVYRTGEMHTQEDLRMMLDRNGDGNLEETYWNVVIQRLTSRNEGIAELLTYGVEVTDLVRARSQQA